MALDIISADEPIKIKQTIIVVYGDSGAGKTSLAFSAADTLALDFAGKGGVHRSAFRGPSALVDDWADVEKMDASDLEPYKTISVDTVGGCLDLMALDIMRGDPKTEYSGSLTLQGYGVLKSRFYGWLRKLQGYGLDIIFVAHGKEEKRGDETVYRPDIVGSSYDLVFSVADAVGRVHMQGTNRMIDWNPSGSAVGKNPAQLPREEIPNLATSPDFLADKLKTIKMAVGSISEEGKRIAQVVAGWSMELEQANSAEDIGVLVENAKKLNDTEACRKQIKAMIARRAKDLGLKWSKEAGGYVD